MGRLPTAPAAAARRGSFLRRTFESSRPGRFDSREGRRAGWTAGLVTRRQSSTPGDADPAWVRAVGRARSAATCRPAAPRPSAGALSGAESSQFPAAPLLQNGPVPSAAPSGFRDPAFRGNRGQPVHRWAPWIAGYSREFVEDALSRHAKRPGVVLDPFAGVGTTLVEADLDGHQVVGYEINPYAAFASRTKLGAHRRDPAALEATIEEFRGFMQTAEARGRSPRSEPPPGFRTRSPFYCPQVMRKVLLALDFVSGIRDAGIADLFRLAFAATMVEYSNYSYEPSLGRRAAVGRPEVTDYPVAETWIAKLTEMGIDIAWCRRTRCRRARPPARIHARSFLDDYERTPVGSVDVLITSPPYLNNYHYNRNTRPQLYWLDFCCRPADLKRLEALNFGTYWQNARDLDRVTLDPAITDREIVDTIEEIRGQNDARGLYGGRGWANYAATYFNDCVRFLRGARWCLRPGGAALVVIGNSILQGVAVPTDRFLASIAESNGMEVVEIHRLRVARVGSSIVHSSIRAGKPAKGKRLYEAVVEFRRG